MSEYRGLVDALPQKQAAAQHTGEEKNRALTRLQHTIQEVAQSQWTPVEEANTQAAQAGIFTRKKARAHAEELRAAFDHHWGTRGIKAEEVPAYLRQLAQHPEHLPAQDHPGITTALQSLREATRNHEEATEVVELFTQRINLHSGKGTDPEKARAAYHRLKAELTRRQTLTPRQQYNEAKTAGTQLSRQGASAPQARPHTPAPPSRRGPGLSR